MKFSNKIAIGPLKSAHDAHNEPHSGDFATCSEPGCFEMRESARQAYVEFLSSGDEIGFAVTMTSIYHDEAVVGINNDLGKAV